jgi:hypothetical protein
MVSVLFDARSFLDICANLDILSSLTLPCQEIGFNKGRFAFHSLLLLVAGPFSVLPFDSRSFDKTCACRYFVFAFAVYGTLSSGFFFLSNEPTPRRSYFANIATMYCVSNDFHSLPTAGPGSRRTSCGSCKASLSRLTRFLLATTNVQMTCAGSLAFDSEM